MIPFAFRAIKVTVKNFFSLGFYYFFKKKSYNQLKNMGYANKSEILIVHRHLRNQ